MQKFISNVTQALTLAAICLALTAVQTFAQAQASTGQIIGVVSDSAGAFVANATVTATNKGTNQEQTATTSDDGLYRFVLLQPGIYTVSVMSSGFAAQTSEVEVQVGRTTDANFTIGAAGQAAEVTVTAEGIQTTRNEFDAVQDQTAIQNLPINGRRFQDFVTLTPTAQVDPQRGQISLSGQRGINTNVNIDGVDYNQPFFGGVRGGERSNSAFTIPQESIREFQVIANGYSAEFGRSSGGIVNAVTKSGTNDFRGSAFYLLRPRQLARANKFAQAIEAGLSTVTVNGTTGIDATLAPTQQQFGGSFGGRIIENKLFFFGSYEQQRVRAPRQVFFGNLASVNVAGSPTSEPLNAAQLNIFNFYRNTLQESFEQTNDAYAGLGRIDWNINESNQFNIRLNASRNTALNAVSVGETALDPTTTSALSNNGIERDKLISTVAALNSNFGANAFNEFRFQYAREERPRSANSELPTVNVAFATFGTRNFLPTTQFDTRYQFQDALTYILGNHTFKFGGEFSRLNASQEFGFNQFGAYSFQGLNNTLNATVLNIANSRIGAPGILQAISNQPYLFTTNPSATVGTIPFLGRFDTTSARYNRQIGNLQAGFKVHELAFFAQDSWRINNKLSINYGLRVEKQFNPAAEANNTEILNVVSNTNFPIRGRGFDGSQIPDSDYQIGPRLGFAYDPNGDGKTVIRGFTGLYYARTPLILFADSVNNFRTPPGNVSTTLPFVGFSQANFNTFLATPAGAQYIAITGCNLGGTAEQIAACTPNSVFRQFAIAGINLNTAPINNLPNVTPTQISTISTALGLSPNPFIGAQITGTAEDFKNPRSFQYGFGIEREVARGFVVGVDFSQVNTDYLQRNRDINLPGALTAQEYVNFLRASNTTAIFNTLTTNGTIDTILRSGRNFIAINTPAGLTFPTGTVTTRPRPTQTQRGFALGAVQLRESTAKQRYRALTLRGRLSRNWGQLNAFYTLSKNESDDDNERDAGGVSFAEASDLRSEFGASRLDRRHQFVANPVFFLPYGFEVASAMRLRSGNPINSTVGVDLNGDGNSNDRPLSAEGITAERNSFRNRRVIDIDLRVQKGFEFGETRRLTFSTEFFNLFNLSNTQITSFDNTRFCSVATANQLCGLNDTTNTNFLQIRNQDSTNVIPVGGLLRNNASGSGVFQVQFGARFQF